MPSESNPPYPIRLTQKLDRQIRSAKRKTGLSKPALMRLAIEIGVPLIEARATEMRRKS